MHSFQGLFLIIDLVAVVYINQPLSISAAMINDGWHVGFELI